MLKETIGIAIAAGIAAIVIPDLLGGRSGDIRPKVVAEPRAKPAAQHHGYVDQRVGNSPYGMNETVHRVPVTIPLIRGSHNGWMIVTAYKPDGPGPFPAIIHHHGTDPDKRASPRRYRQFRYARYWVSRGFAVFAVTRLGFGDAGLEPFPERIYGGCRNPNFQLIYDSLAAQSEAALRYVRSLQYVRYNQIVLSGQSRGGTTVIAHLANNADGVIGGINFAGSYAYGQKPSRPDGCRFDKMKKLLSQHGRRARAPSLWVFGSDDKLHPLENVYKRVEAYNRGGGDAELFVIPKQRDLNGHYVISRPRLWEKKVDAFVESLDIRLGVVGIAAR